MTDRPSLHDIALAHMKGVMAKHVNDALCEVMVKDDVFLGLEEWLTNTYEGASGRLEFYSCVGNEGVVRVASNTSDLIFDVKLDFSDLDGPFWAYDDFDDEDLEVFTSNIDALISKLRKHRDFTVASYLHHKDQQEALERKE